VTLKYRITLSKNSQEQLHGEVQVQNIGNLRVTLKYRRKSKNSREQLRGEVQVQNIGNLIEGGIAKNLRNCHHVTLIGL
jgi:adenylate kinase